MRIATLRYWGRGGVLLLALLVLPSALSAQTPRFEDLRKLALAFEQRGDWAEACRYYDEAQRRDRHRVDCREGYQRCLRHFYLQNRHRDPAYRDVLAKLTPFQALEVYDEVLFIVSHVYTDRNKADLTSLFQQGLREIRYALDEDLFRREYLPNVRPEAVKAFRKSLDGWNDKKINSRQEAREEVLAVVRTSQQFGLGLRPTVLALEFACGACNALDEYTLFLTPGHQADVQAMLRGRMVDVGIHLTPKLEIDAVYPRSPAEEQGLAVGDRLLTINGKPVDQLSAEAVESLLRGESGTLVVLEVLRPGMMEPLLRRLLRRPVMVPSVEYRLPAVEGGDAEIGYLRINHFQDNTLQEVKDAVVSMQTTGMKALIVDLRGNPGGVFKSAVQVSELFLGEGVIVYTESRVKDYNRPFRADIMNPLVVPMAVLVDQETASSAEIVAGALKDLPRVRLLGQTTFGKGSIQSVIPLRKSPGGIRITVAQFFSPTRQPYSGRGITPHDFVPTEGNTCVTAAHAHLQSILRMMIMR